ncbi:polysaccharide lyase family 8 super-sandwich domain-containing protein [Pontiella sulfatireligans]|uniref:Xanthan lyase n=1 Tax=Pontiella sulfatireligans TaxID=2750658 RepID=A0A6C2UDI3_9BACT|nr:polysaccharide lyase family 8 super-sandwich domain-containing protein [Pontiella sulfatireligans]VGO18195.1 Xanthan lyase [Pontiella sulfatireligans]
MGQKINRLATVDGTQEEILTTINNVRRLTDVTYSINGSAITNISLGTALEERHAVTNVAWSHHDGMGYVIWPSVNPTTELVLSFGDRPFNPILEADEEWETRIQDELGTAVWSSKVIDMFRLWLDHGATPVDDTYRYAVLPDCTLAELQAYATNPPVQVAANLGGVQAIANILRRGSVFPPRHSAELQ